MGGGDPAEEAERGSATASGGRAGARAAAASRPEDAAPQHQGAQPGRPDPTGHTVMGAGPGGRPGGGRGGGEAGSGGTAAGSARLGARSRTPATRRRALRGAKAAGGGGGPGWLGRRGALEGLFMSPRAGQAPPPVPPAPRAEPPPRPRSAAGSSSSLYNAGGREGGLRRRPPPRCPLRALPQGLGTGHPRLPALRQPRSPAWGLRPGR